MDPENFIEEEYADFVVDIYSELAARQNNSVVKEELNITDSLEEIDDSGSIKCEDSN